MKLSQVLLLSTSLLLSQIGAAPLSIEEFSIHLASSDRNASFSSILIGPNASNVFADNGLELSYINRSDADGMGYYDISLVNRTQNDLHNVKIFAFLDLSIDETSNGFTNEHGSYVAIDGQGISDLLPDFWQIDEPGYLAGSIFEHIEQGFLDQTNHIPATAKNDTALAIGFDIGTFPVNGVQTLHYALNRSGTTGLAQTDPDSGLTYYLSALADEIILDIASPPVVHDDVAAGVSKQPVIVDILANDTDADGDINASSVNIVMPSSIDSDGDGDFDRITVYLEGTWNIDNTTGQVTFVPVSGFTADPTPITYEVLDATGLLSNTATVSVDYPQSAPVTIDDAANAATGQKVTIDVLANDTDSENDIDPASVRFTAAATTDSDGDGDADTLVVAGEGVWQCDNTTGAVSFTPETDFTADPTAIGYSVVDRTGLVSNTANLSVDYLQIAPVATDDATSAQVGKSITVALLANDTDANGDLAAGSVHLTHLQATDSDADGDNDKLVVQGEGNWSVDNISGSVTFVPETGFTADPTVITYVVKDRTGLASNSASVTVDYLQTPPVAYADTVTAATSQPVSIAVLANDTDAENDILVQSVHIVTPSAIDTDSDGDNDFLSVPGEGNWSVDNLTGVVTFVPAATFTADPTPVNYAVSDSMGLLSNPASVTVDYLQAAPVAVNDSVAVASVQQIIVDILANDTDENGDLDPRTVTLLHPLASDSDGDGDNDTLIIAGEGNWSVDNIDGKTTFTPVPGFTGDPTPQSYRVSDTTGLISNTATVTVDFPQTAPVANADSTTSATSQSVQIDLTANDADAQNDMDAATVHLTHAAATDSDGDGDNDTLFVTGEGNWSVNNLNGVITFVPATDFTADPTTISYVISDRTGLTSAPATIAVDYLQIAPVATDDNASLTAFTPLTIALLANDTDANGDLDMSSVNLNVPTAQDSDGDGDNDWLIVAGEGNWSVDNLTGDLSFTPESTLTTAPTPVQYTVSDRTSLVSNLAVVTVAYDITNGNGNGNQNDNNASNGGTDNNSSTGGGDNGHDDEEHDDDGEHNDDSDECNDQLINGSFEEHRKFNVNDWAMHSKTLGWKMHPAAKISEGDAADGMAKLELDAHTNGYTTQTVETEEERTYTLHFSYMPRSDERPSAKSSKKNKAPSDRAVEVYWNDEKLITLRGGEIGWQPYDITVHGDGENAELRFEAVGSGDDYSGYIDYVRLCEEEE